MRRALLLLLACVLVVAAVVWIALLPGAVRFEAGDLSIDAATPTLVFAALLALGLFYLLIRVLIALARLPHRIRTGRAERRRREGDVAVTRTLVALAGNHQSQAVTEAGRARKLLGDTPHTLKLAAEAHGLAGQHDAARDCYTRLSHHAEAALVGLRGLADQAASQGKWEEVSGIADQAQRLDPNGAWARDLRGQLAQQRGDWKGALSLSGPEAPRQAFAAAAAAAEPDAQEGLKLARDAFRAAPGFTPAALTYATRLRAHGEDRKAWSVLQESWRANPNPEVGEAALALSPGAEARLRAARLLTEADPDHPESQLLLGRAALDAGDLAAARDAADRVKALDQRRAWALVAEVEDRISHDSAAVRAAWARAATAAPDPGWQCARCARKNPHWAARCPQCGTAGSLEWR
jgi:HemY protein